MGPKEQEHSLGFAKLIDRRVELLIDQFAVRRVEIVAELELIARFHVGDFEEHRLAVGRTAGEEELNVTGGQAVLEYDLTDQSRYFRLLLP